MHEQYMWWNARLLAKIEELQRTAPARVACAEQRAFGEVRGVNAMNDALWRLKAFKHEPPFQDDFPRTTIAPPPTAEN